VKDRCGEVRWHEQLRYVKILGDECGKRVEFERHVAFVRETSGDFREGLRQDESDGLWRY